MAKDRTEPSKGRADWTGLADDLARRFAPRAARWDRDCLYPHDNVAELVEARVMGMTIPQDLGGQGADWSDVVAVVDRVAGACTLTARIVVEGNMGAVGAIMAYGTQAQKEAAAALVLSGDKPAICITEPDAGSDATAMRTTARPVPGGWRIDGRKHWITGGGVSRLHLVIAQCRDAGDRPRGIGAFIVMADPAGRGYPEGFRIVRHERTMGLRGMPEAELAFENLFVPDEHVLPLPGGAGRGFPALMSAYNSQRVGAAAVAAGVAGGALALARDRLRTRRQFGRPLAEFQGLQWMIADMDTAVEASRMLIARAAASRGDDGHPFPDPVMTARAKLFASESAIRVVSDALQMFGARGYGAEEPLERMYRDVRMFTLGGGTAQVLRTLIGGHVLGIRTPQTRDGYLKLAEGGE